MRKHPRLFALALAAASVLLMAAASGKINWTQINPLFRHGTGSYGQASDGTGGPGNCAKFDANGNTTDSGVTCVGATGNYQTLGINGTSQTQRGRLNLIPGTNVTITSADNAGTNSSDVTISASAGGGGGVTLTAPVSANWTAFNTAGMGQSPTYASGRFSMESSSQGSNNVQGLYTSLPTVPYDKVFRIWPFPANESYSGCGVGWSDGTKYVLVDVFVTAGGANQLGPAVLNVIQFANVTTSGASQTLQHPLASVAKQIPGGVPVWIRLQDDSTNWNAYISWDSTTGSNGNWLLVFQQARNTYLTATQLVAFVNGPSSEPAGLLFDSFSDF